MNIFSKIAVVASVAILTLTSCSSAAILYPMKQTSEIELTMSSFYSKSIESAPETRKSLRNISEQLEEIVSSEDNDVLKSSNDAFSKLQNLSTEGQTKVANFYKSKNPVDDYYSFEGLTDAQVAGVSLMSLITTSYYTSSELAKDSKEIGEDNISIIDDTHASVKFYSESSSSKYDTYLVKTDAGWKIDGKKNYDQYAAVMKK